MAEHFEEGVNLPNIRVCRLLSSANRVCNPSSIPEMLDLGYVTVVVAHNTARLFPFGPNTQDGTFHGVIEGTVAIIPPADIPFFDGNYRILYVRKHKHACTTELRYAQDIEECSVGVC